MKPADSTLARTGGQIPGRRAQDPRRRHGLRRAGRELSGRARRAARLRDDIKFVICRQEGGASNMAEAYGKLTGPPGICFVTRGPGATNASDRRSHRAPGFDADDPVHRPGRQRLRRARSLPGNRLPPHVRPDGEMGRADRPRRPRARICQPRVPSRGVAAGPGRWCSRCPKTCRPRARRSPTRHATSASPRIPAPAICRSCARCLRKRSARS